MNYFESRYSLGFSDGSVALNYYDTDTYISKLKHVQAYHKSYKGTQFKRKTSRILQIM